MTAYDDLEKCEFKERRFCDCCGMEAGQKLLHWEEKDFDLCVQCVINLNFTYNQREFAIIEELAKEPYNDESLDPLEATMVL